MSILYLILIGLAVFLALLAGPLLLGRLFMPRLTLAAIRKFGKPVAKLLNRIRPELDLKLLVKAGNRYFAREFAETPFERRILFIPICLCPPLCPAEVNPEQGLVCPGDCPRCIVGILKKEAEGLGYGRVLIVPSSRMMPGRGLKRSDQFIKEKLGQEGVDAALGIVCGWHLRNRLLPGHSVGSRGYAPEGRGRGKAVLQGVLLDQRKCRGGTVDWEEVKAKLRQGREKV